MAEDKKYNRLQKLSGSDYEIVDGEPDIRGWDVRDAAGKRLGEVDDLIFDRQDNRVRYVVLDLNGNDYDLEDRDVLVPIGLAELHKSDDDVILSNVTAEQLQALPEYDEDNFDEEKESRIHNVFAGAGTAVLAAGGASLYNHEHYNDDKFYRNRRQNAEAENETTIPVVNEELEVGKREVETGGIRLRSRVVEKEVAEDINLREENVRVERNAVDRAATADDLVEDEVEMREYEEVPVVNKQARVVEEVRLSKDINEREETIRDTVRNTEVDVDRTGETRSNDRDDLRSDRGI